MVKHYSMSRRHFVGMGSLLAASTLLPMSVLATKGQIHKAIPKTAEQVPVIGMGTSRTFDAGRNPALLKQLQQVIQSFFDAGGGMIDSSPMYGSAQAVLGQLLPLKSGLKAGTLVLNRWRTHEKPGALDVLI